MSVRSTSRRILVIKNRAIGDTLLLTGILRVLRKHRPHHKIHVLVKAPAGELLEGLPYVDRIISVYEPDTKFERLAYWTRLVRRMRTKRYETVFNFHASFRTSLFGKLLRGNVAVSNNHALKGRNWFSDVLVPGRGIVKSIIDRDLDVLRAMGIFATADEAMPEVRLTEVEKRDAAARLKGTHSGLRVFLGIGASRETKRWEPEHVVGLMRKLADTYNAHFVLASTKTDEAWLKKFQPYLKTQPDLEKRLVHVENLPLRKVAALVSCCQLYVGNDSGLKHLAVALGLKTFTIFGPESPKEWHPYNRTQHPYAYQEALACRTEGGLHWCSIATCVKHGQKCTKDLTPEVVWPMIQALIGSLEKESAVHELR